MKLKVYLAGNMEVSKNNDLGASWRNELTPFLLGLGLMVKDPVNLEAEKLGSARVKRLPKTCTHFQTLEEYPVKHWHDLKYAKETKYYERFKRYITQIIKYDLKIVSECDIIICNWSKETRKGGGTYGELTHAKELGIPVYSVVTTDVPAWIMGTFTERFNSFDELKEFIREEFADV